MLLSNLAPSKLLQINSLVPHQPEQEGGEKNNKSNALVHG
jgi:hypothetical protein